MASRRPILSLKSPAPSILSLRKLPDSFPDNVANLLLFDDGVSSSQSQLVDGHDPAYDKWDEDDSRPSSYSEVDGHDPAYDKWDEEISPPSSCSVVDGNSNLSSESDSDDFICNSQPELDRNSRLARRIFDSSLHSKSRINEKSPYVPMSQESLFFSDDSEDLVFTEVSEVQRPHVPMSQESLVFSDDHRDWSELKREWSKRPHVPMSQESLVFSDDHRDWFKSKRPRPMVMSDDSEDLVFTEVSEVQREWFKTTKRPRSFFEFTEDSYDSE